MKPMHNRRKWRSRAQKRKWVAGKPRRRAIALLKAYSRTEGWVRDTYYVLIRELMQNHTGLKPQIIRSLKKYEYGVEPLHPSPLKWPISVITNRPF